LGRASIPSSEVCDVVGGWMARVSLMR
jgi:hypothetical protein